MLDKNLVKNNFKKSILSYDNYAVIQDSISCKLINLIPEKKYANILEVGSYTGILTKKIVSFNPEFESYFAVDIVQESANFIREINDKIKFINSDIEAFNTDKKFDLIISNVTLQWCLDFNSIFVKLKSYLNKDGIIAISIFKDGNLPEIKEAFGVSLNYPDENYILNMKNENNLSPFSKIYSETIPVKFDKSIDILRHLKYTGVNSLKNNNSITSLKKGLRILEEKFENKITYKPLYIIDKCS